MESKDLQILNSSEIEVDPTLLNYAFIAITEDKNDIDAIMPVDFFMRVRDAIRLMKVLASPIDIDCPFMDFMGTLVDDLREYSVRACPECWRLFCVSCICLHLGVICENYQFSRQLNLFYSQQHYRGYHDELEEDEEEEEEDEDDDDEGEEEEREGEGEETP
ncbi:hypothetical protein H5410_030159 [Solanum commersonii]|uniref:Uncharacterized protein n=1 Tax=Solanum commersonii TaxID=4109 RepID=A0A9J5YFB9_SOLCO|nr:hypothetical protein H5410_030159 [Solanum commersonii]